MYIHVFIYIYIYIRLSHHALCTCRRRVCRGVQPARRVAGGVFDSPFALDLTPPIYIAWCLCTTSPPSLNHCFDACRAWGNCLPLPNAIHTVLPIDHRARDFPK